MYVGLIDFYHLDGRLIWQTATEINSDYFTLYCSQDGNTWKELDCHIVTVIHSNFGTDKPTGHLGSFLEKKTETQISLELNTVNKGLVKVSCKRSRNAPFEDFNFKVNNFGLPQVEGAFYDPLKDIF